MSDASDYVMGRYIGDLPEWVQLWARTEFAAAGRIDSVQLAMAREIKRKWLARGARSHD